MTTFVSMNLNGRNREDAISDNILLVDFLREVVALTGTKIGCDRAECASCTVLINNKPRHACLTLASACDNSLVETIESLEKGGRLSAIQRGFHEKLGAQCGFCTPGMVMAAEGLLRENTEPNENEIRKGMAANICRCTGYVKIIESVQAAVNEVASKAGSS